MNEQCNGMSPESARKLAEDVKKCLTSVNQWCTVVEINEPNLRFIKIEASIKVKHNPEKPARKAPAIPQPPVKTGVPDIRLGINAERPDVKMK